MNRMEHWLSNLNQIRTLSFCHNSPPDASIHLSVTTGPSEEHGHGFPFNLSVLAQGTPPNMAEAKHNITPTTDFLLPSSVACSPSHIYWSIFWEPTVVWTNMPHPQQWFQMQLSSVVVTLSWSWGCPWGGWTNRPHLSNPWCLMCNMVSIGRGNVTLQVGILFSLYCRVTVPYVLSLQCEYCRISGLRGQLRSVES